jgi:CHAD domain-containing protein
VLTGSPDVVAALALSPELGHVPRTSLRRERSEEIYFDTRSRSLLAARRRLSIVRSRGQLVERHEEQIGAPGAGRFETAVRWQAASVVRARLARRALESRLYTSAAGAGLAPRWVLEREVASRKVEAGGLTHVVRFETIELCSRTRMRRLARVVIRYARAREVEAYLLALTLLSHAARLRPAREDALGSLVGGGGARRSLPLSPAIATSRAADSQALVRAAIALCTCGVENAERGDLRTEEGIHRLRIAVRRLRAVLRMLRRSLGPQGVRPREDLAEFATALGAVRDVDVFLAHVAASDLPPASREELTARAERARRAAFAELMRAIDAPGHARLVLELGLLACTAGGVKGRRPGADSVSARKAARWLVERADRAALRAARGFSRLDADERHRLRLRVKDARYAVEILAPLLPPKRAARYARTAQRLQDALGVECDWLRLRELTHRWAPEEAERIARSLAPDIAAVRAEAERALRRFRRAQRPGD